VSIISDDIQNYFDPTKTECIRYGYEKEMWLEHDAAFNVLRIGLVSGATATLPNVFPVFDLVTKTWSFDTPAQELSCVAGVEAGSGQAPVVMVGGGIDDGTVYQLNYGTVDVTTAIRALIEMVVNFKALVISVDEVLIRFGAQTDGAAVLAAYENERLKWTKQLPLTSQRVGDTSRRHRFSCSLTGDLMTLEISHSSTTKSMKIYEIGLETSLWEAK
jgi:hypothetical protein